ncbi:MAG: PEP-CTERM sorting domain-containing protein [Desulfobacteraceae bacterium]|nr:PEP-CTERM sorting domain-containing protein [Desulfobacteraceae bacterium]
MRKSLMLGLFLALLVAPFTAQADSITPESYSATIDVGESVTITKTVTISDAPPSSAKVDVLFMFDTTGSMGGLLEAAKTNAKTILSNAGSLGDVSFGVAHYEDFAVSPYGSIGDTPFELVNDLTDAEGAQKGIKNLGLGDGYDGPESNLYALSEAAENVSWREGSTRIIVWFGDAPGHDGDLEPGYPSRIGLDDTIAALNDKNIVVEAINVSSLPSWGLNRGLAYGGHDGQASAIADGTGGTFYDVADPGAIVSVIDDAIESVFATYDEVTLEVVGADNVSVEFSSVSYNGGYTREEECSFTFDVTYTGDTEGVDEIQINALVDGGIVGIGYDTITVGSIPEPASMLLMGIGFVGLAGMTRLRRKKVN